MSKQIPIDQFVEELDKVSRWYDLGVFLGVPTSELDIIGQMYCSEGIQRRLIELFKCFQSRSKPVSWNDIAEALTKMHNNDLANQLRHKYVWINPFPSPSIEGKSSVSESNTQVKNTKHPNDGNDDSVFVNKQIIKAFNTLTTSFARLVLHIKIMLQKESVSIHDVQIFLQAKCDLEPFSPDMVTMEKVFSRLHNHYCFLNYHVLISIVDTFLGKNMLLKKSIENYNSELKSFKESTEMKQLMDMIKEKRDFCGGHKVVELKLYNYWENISIKRFERMARVVFLESYKLLVQIRVSDGCMCVSWVVPDTSALMHIKTKSINFKFMKAVGIISVKIGDEIVYECLDEGCSVLESAFLQAFELAHVHAMELLLAIGCDFNTRTYTGEVAITSAMRMKDSNGFTILHYASMNGHDDTVRTLLESGASPADLNACNKNGSTAIYVASQNGHLGIVDMLLQFGADPNIKRSDGWTPPMIASTNGHSDVVELLLNAKVDVNACNKKGSTAIYIASCNGHLDVVQKLLQSGADPNLKKKNLWTPLMIASANGHNDVVELLLNAKVDVNACNKEGSTAIYIASKNGQFAVVSTLLRFGADPNLTKRDGWTPLMIAIQKGHTKVIDQLLSADVEINACSNDGTTPIYVACQNGNSYVASTLLRFGANPNLKKIDGWTCVAIANDIGYNDIAELLQEYQG